MMRMYLKKIDVQFVGECEGYFYFNDLQTWSTLTMQVDGFNYRKLAEHVKKSRESFVEAG